jgi:hypothetical protein
MLHTLQLLGVLIKEVSPVEMKIWQANEHQTALMIDILQQYPFQDSVGLTLEHTSIDQPFQSLV